MHPAFPAAHSLRKPPPIREASVCSLVPTGPRHPCYYPSFNLSSSFEVPRKWYHLLLLETLISRPASTGGSSELSEYMQSVEHTIVVYFELVFSLRPDGRPLGMEPRFKTPTPLAFPKTSLLQFSPLSHSTP